MRFGFLRAECALYLRDCGHEVGMIMRQGAESCKTITNVSVKA
jgi:hypothetical protein